MAGRPKKRIAELLSKDDPLCVLLSLISDKESCVGICRGLALKWAPVKFVALFHYQIPNFSKRCLQSEPSGVTSANTFVQKFR